MPVAIPRPDPLTPLLRGRLEATLPGHERGDICDALNRLLDSVRNVPPVTCAPPPTDQHTAYPMAQVYLRLVKPVAGTVAGPFSAAEQHTVDLLRYLDEVQKAPPLDPRADPAVARPQSHVHAHLLHELRREFGLLHCSFPYNWRELAVSDLAAKVLVEAQQLNFQPTEVRVIAEQELPPEAGRHRGGVNLTVVAWNGAMPPGPAATSSDPNVWDPNNPLGNGPDLLRAPLQLEWMGTMPL